MKHLLKFLKDYKKETFLAPLFKLLEAVFELFVPLLVAGIIDVGIPNEDKKFVGLMFGLLVALAVIGLVCSITAQFFAAKAATGVSSKIRSALFAHIQHLSFSQIDKEKTSTLITRMTNDINQVQTGINMVLRLFLRSPIIVFGAMIMAFTIDVKSGFIFTVLIPALAVVVMGIILGTIPMHKRVQAALDVVLGTTRENLSGARVIRAFRKEAHEVSAFKQQTRDLYEKQDSVGAITAILNPVTFVLVNIALVILIRTGAVRVNSGLLSQGMLIALWNYMSQILVELVKLSNLIVTVTKSVACGDRVWAVLSIDEDEPEEDKASKVNMALHSDIAVEFENVSLTYNEGAQSALKDISFRALRGETIGIIGGTGSGKTSLVNMIPGFYPPTKGNIKIFGQDISAFTKSELRAKVSVAMQNPVLFSGTIESNLKMGKADATKEEMDLAIEIAQASEVVAGKGGVEGIVSQAGKNFSGGQKQRLALARALISKKEILILDDTASALDFATEASLRKALREKLTDTTVFIVSQRTSSIMHADKIIVLDDGVVEGIGSHSELLKNCEVYREIFLSQFPERAGELNG